MESIMQLGCCLPSLYSVAGGLCATTVYTVRKKLAQRKKKTSLWMKVKPKVSPKFIKRFIKNSKSAPAKIENQTYNHWKSDVLETLDKYNVNLDVTFDYALSFWKQEQAEKVAEGSNGEIYSFQHVDSLRILKLIAVNSKHPLKETPNIPLTLALSDIVCSVTLSRLTDGYLFQAPNFPQVYRVCIVKDKFPNTLAAAWAAYERKFALTDDPTQYPRPDLYIENSRFITIESSHCGNPLSKQIKTLQNAWLGASIMTQLVAAFAVAEEACGFEHRDLHLENVLIKETKASELEYSLDKLKFSVKTAGHQVFIIDFSFSRLNDGSKIYSVPATESSISPEEHHKVIFKKMVDILKDDFQVFTPKTNILWLQYVMENIIQGLYKKEPSFLCLVASPSVGHQMAPMRMLRKWNEVILCYNSSKEFLTDVVLFENPLVEFFHPHETA